MTPTGKPDDDHEGERPEPGQTPPPPRWMDDQGSSGPLLLPADDPEDDPEDDLEEDPEGDDFPEDSPRTTRKGTWRTAPSWTPTSTRR
ncbi:hypothetical protein ACFQY7_46055 [Actinomadura luteofluorescens]|uniref:hypothetical protein n=1 Tax=Actinomadura luteofluorescens TaxID=46163 RepID=UPI00362E2A70